MSIAFAYYRPPPPPLYEQTLCRSSSTVFGQHSQMPAFNLRPKTKQMQSRRASDSIFSLTFINHVMKKWTWTIPKTSWPALRPLPPKLAMPKLFVGGASQYWIAIKWKSKMLALERGFWKLNGKCSPHSPWSPRSSSLVTSANVPPVRQDLLKAQTHNRKSPW